MFQGFNQGFSHARRRFSDRNTGFPQRFNLPSGSSLAARHYSSRVPHASARRRRRSSNERRYRSIVILFNPSCSLFFRSTTYFADDNQRLGARIFVEEFHGVQMRRPVDGIPSDSNTG